MRCKRFALPLLSLLPGVAAALAFTASAEGLLPRAEAQVFVGPPAVPFYRPVRPFFFRPRVVIMPPQVYAPPVYVQPPVYAPPPVYVQPPPVYVQPPPVYTQPAPPPPVYTQPAPPPVYTQPLPPPPVYTQPAPPPVYVQPMAPRLYAPRPMLPQWQTRIGLGGRFAGTINRDDSLQSVQFGQLGFGGEMLFRVQRHIVLELASEYQRSLYGAGEFHRYDVPVTFGARFHLGGPEWVVSPYLVAAAGLNYANLDYVHAHDIAWFALGQVGGGLELRLGKHFAINGDVRAEGRRRLSDPDEATAATTSINGKPFAPMGNQYGGQFRLGAAVYF